MKNDFVNEILEIEWEMFTTVNSSDGRASCQDDRKSFQIMRSAQETVFPEELLESYLQDLRDARRQGRNLMTEKYARMMEYTFPGEYNNIKNLLPEVSERMQQLAREISHTFAQWDAETREKYPALSSIGRPSDTGSDMYGVISSESYLRCELLTMSERTLAHYAEFVAGQLRAGGNPQMNILENTVLQYGYTSLDQANATITEKQRRRKEMGFDQLCQDMCATCCCD